MRRRKQVKVVMVLSVAPHLTAAQARLEARTRINELCGYWDSIDTPDVRVRRMKGSR